MNQKIGIFKANTLSNANCQITVKYKAIISVEGTIIIKVGTMARIWALWVMVTLTPPLQKVGKQ